MTGRNLQKVLVETFVQSDTDIGPFQDSLKEEVELAVIRIKEKYPKVFEGIDPDPDEARMWLIYMIRGACYRLIKAAELEIEAVAEVEG